MSVNLLFGYPGCWSSRHPRTVLAAVIALMLTADRIADVLAAAIAGAP
jgi:hypothetical protein